MIVNIKKLGHSVDELPKYATKYSSGLDLYASTTDFIILNPNEVKAIPTGIAIQLMEGYEAQVRPRSGLALKSGISVLNSPGTIDADYRGEIKVILINHSSEAFMVERGMKIAQLVIAPYIKIEWNEVNELTNSIRGDKGFGSTGV